MTPPQPPRALVSAAVAKLLLPPPPSRVVSAQAGALHRLHLALPPSRAQHIRPTDARLSAVDITPRARGRAAEAQHRARRANRRRFCSLREDGPKKAPLSDESTKTALGPSKGETMLQLGAAIVVRVVFALQGWCVCFFLRGSASVVPRAPGLGREREGGEPTGWAGNQRLWCVTCN